MKKTLQQLATAKSKNQGFTLIELMIVVAIIGILAAVALPAYSSYQASSKLTAALSEISGAKTEIEILASNGQALASAGALNAFPAVSTGNVTTENCIISATMSAAGVATLACAVENAPSQVTNATVTWSRATNGVWTCATTGATDASLAPRSCPQASS